MKHEGHPCHDLAVCSSPLSGCSFFQISDEYGNTYGGLADFGNQYAWQLSTCEADPGLVEAPSPIASAGCNAACGATACRSTIPTGCDAPPYYKHPG